MKFLGKTHIIIMFVILFACAVWIEIKLIEMYLEYEKTQKMSVSNKESKLLRDIKEVKKAFL